MRQVVDRGAAVYQMLAKQAKAVVAASSKLGRFDDAMAASSISHPQLQQDQQPHNSSMAPTMVFLGAPGAGNCLLILTAPQLPLVLKMLCVTLHLTVGCALLLQTSNTVHRFTFYTSKYRQLEPAARAQQTLKSRGAVTSVCAGTHGSVRCSCSSRSLMHA